VTRGGAFTLNDAGGLTVSGPLTAGTTANAVSITTTGGALAVNGNISATGAGAVTLSGVGVNNNAVVRGDGGVAVGAGTGTITNNGTFTNNATAAAISLTADDMVLSGGTITAGTGAVNLTSTTAGQAITVGGGASGLGLSIAELNTITTTGNLTIGTAGHTSSIQIDGAGTLNGAASGLLSIVNGGNIAVDAVLTVPVDMQVTTTAAVTDAGGGRLILTGGRNLNINSGTGIGSVANPLHTNTSSLTATNTTGNDVHIQNSGTVTLATNFRNQAAGGKLWLETLNGAINTGAVGVSTNNGQMILTANDTSGGNNGQINLGSGGLASGGGMIALHGADVITLQNGAGINTGGGNAELISGTGAGLNTALITKPASETTGDEFGAIFIGAPISTGAGNTLLVASTSTTPTIIAGVVQGISSGTVTGTSPLVSSINPTTGAAVGTAGPIITNTLTVVTLRGTGGAFNGGAAIDLQNAANTSGSINLFACPLIGCPDTSLPGTTRTSGPFVTAPMINNTNAPNAPTPGKYADGPIFYIDTGGTNVSGVGTVNDFTFFTPGNVTINTVQQARNLRLEASGDIDVSLTAPVDNTVILKNGSLQLIAGNDIRYNPTTAGNTFGAPGTTFNRNLKFISAGSIDINNAIYQGNDTTGPGTVVTTLDIKANQDVNLNSGMVVIARKNPTYNTGSGIGDVTFRGNHEVSNLGGINVEGVNIKVLGGSLGSANQSTFGELIKSAGIINFNATFTPPTPPANTGNISLIAGAAVPGTSNSGTVVDGGAVNIGSAGVRANDLILTGGSNTVNGSGSRASDAAILSAGQINIQLAGNAVLTGGAATANGAAVTETSTALATISGSSVNFDALGNVTLQGGTANANSGASSTLIFGADASASMLSKSAFTPKVGGNLRLSGGTSTATAPAGQSVRAKSQALLQGTSLDVTTGGSLTLDNSAALATADVSAGGTAVASSSALLSSSADKKFKVGGNFDIIGGNVGTGNATVIGGSAGSADTLAGTDAATGTSTLEAMVTGSMNLSSGFEVGGTTASAAAVLLAAGEIKLTTAALNITGNSTSGLFRSVPGFTERLDGTRPPIAVNGNGAGITIFQDAMRGPSIILSGAPPTNLDQLQAGIINAIQQTQGNRSAGFESDVNNAKNKPVDASRVCK
jgi:hypothetical protein